jgi:Domain of unknown function (DUF4384)/Curli production assembly/transport component CsgG
MYKVFLLLVAFSSGLIVNADIYDKIGVDLAKQVEPKTVHIGIGNFVYADTKLMSSFSAMLQDELSTALAKNTKFKVISREKLDDLLKEQRLQNLDLFDPNSKKINIKIKGIEGIIRGRFYYQHPKITVFVKLLWLDGGEIKTTKVILNADNISTEILPANLAKSKKNIIDIRKRIKKVPHDFKIKLSTIGMKRNFKNGEKVQFKVRAEKDCHIAVFCHQIDGKTVLLFPNIWQKNTFIKANTNIIIPKTKNKKFDIEVGQPFGSDVIQVIACARKSTLHNKMERLAKSQSNLVYRNLSRGLFSKVVDESINNSPNKTKPRPKRLWGEAHILISTYKK